MALTTRIYELSSPRFVRSASVRLTRRFLRARAEPLTLTGAPALVVAPHQDDETFGCGGAIALKRSLGAEVRVVFVTDGRYGQSSDLPLDDLVAARQHEAIAALAELGVDRTSIRFLGVEDGSLEHIEPGRTAELTSAIAAEIEDLGAPDVFVTYEHDNHMDHRVTHRIVRAAVEQVARTSGRTLDVYEYPIWAFYQNPVFHKLRRRDLARARSLDVTSVRARKEAAIARYPSQLDELPRVIVDAARDGDELYLHS